MTTRTLFSAARSLAWSARVPLLRVPRPSSALNRCCFYSQRNGDRHGYSSRLHNYRGMRRILLKPAIFTASVTFGSFAAVAIHRCEEDRRAASHVGGTLSYYSMKGVSDALRWWRLPGDVAKSLPASVVDSVEKLANDSRLPTVGPIIAANGAVFCAFGLAAATKRRFPRLGIMLDRLFVHNTASGQALPLLLSCFAHTGALHLGCNMYVLWTFGDPLVKLFGGRENFWAAYLSACSLSSFGAICLGLVMRAVASHPLSTGLGASGGLIGVVVAYALANPESRVGIIFLPGIDFSAHDMVIGLVAFDIAGLLAGWGALGHAAHLSGAAIGFYAVEMGGLQKHLPLYLNAVYGWWHRMRERLDEK